MIIIKEAAQKTFPTHFSLTIIFFELADYSSLLATCALESNKKKDFSGGQQQFLRQQKMPRTYSARHVLNN